MIHEVLLALVGHPGDVIKREETGFYVSSGLPFLNPAEKVSVRAVVSRAECGVGIGLFEPTALVRSFPTKHPGVVTQQGCTDARPHAWTVATRPAT